MDDIDHAARGEELLKEAEKKINCRSFPVLASNSNYEDPAQLLRKSAISFRLAKSWDKAGSVFVKLSEHRMKFNGKFEAAMAYKDAARCYQKTSTEGAIPCLKQAITILTEIGTSYSLAAMYCKKAIEIYEDIAKQSLNDNLLKYEVGGHLLNAGICQLCQGDFVAIANSLKRYQDLYPTFSTTREYKFLADLAASIDEKDVAKFTRVFNEFEKVTPLHSWKSTLLLKVKDVLKAKEMEKLKVKDALKAKEMEKDESKS